MCVFVSCLQRSSKVIEGMVFQYLWCVCVCVCVCGWVGGYGHAHVHVYMFVCVFIVSKPIILYSTKVPRSFNFCIFQG